MAIASRLSRRNFLRLSTGAAAIGFLAACAPVATPAQQGAAPAASGGAAPSGQAVTLRFITNHGDADQPLFETLLSEFAKKEPNIKIDHLDIGGGTDFYNAINTQGAAGQLPDVWYTRTFDIPVYASKQWTISLQSYVDRDAAEVKVDDFWPAEVAQMKWKGELYALPYDFSNVGIYYNKDMFDAAGVTYPTDDWKWDDLLQTALKFVKKDGNDYTAWGLDMYLWDWVFHGIMYGWGGNVWSDDFKTFVGNSPENEACFKWFNDARKQGLYPEAGTTPQGVDAFSAALVPMAFQGSWATTSLRASIADKFKFDCVAMPKSPSGQPCINAAGGAWGIAKNSPNPEQAWTFNKYLTSTEGANILISDPLRSIPGRQSSVPVWNETAAKGGLPPANVGIFPKQMDGAHASPYPPYWQDYDQAWNNIVVPALNGTTDEDPATTLKTFETEVNRIIEQNKASLG